MKDAAPGGKGSIKVLMSRDDQYHQRGYWVVVHALRNAGMEVVLGGVQVPMEIAATALQEDVDVIGYRIMQGAPCILVSLLFDQMQRLGIHDKPVVIGGIIPDDEEKRLRELGVKEVFHPFSPLKAIVEKINAIASAYRAEAHRGDRL
jgi:methylmalonyl-CoA mutase C-terminal domain/subunit